MKKNYIKSSLILMLLSFSLIFVSCDNKAVISEDISTGNDVKNKNTSSDKDMLSKNIATDSNIKTEDTTTDSNIKSEKSSNENTLMPEDNNSDITIKENTSFEEIGFIKNIYISNNKVYLEFDAAKFLTGDEALQEAIRINSPKIYVEEDGIKWIPDGYLLINDFPYLKTYEVSSDASFALCCYDVIYECQNSNSSGVAPISYDEFMQYYNNKINYEYSLDNPDLLFWINGENGIIYNMHKQYTP